MRHHHHDLNTPHPSRWLLSAIVGENAASGKRLRRLSSICLSRCSAASRSMLVRRAAMGTSPPTDRFAYRPRGRELKPAGGPTGQVVTCSTAGAAVSRTSAPVAIPAADGRAGATRNCTPLRFLASPSDRIAVPRNLREVSLAGPPERCSWLSCARGSASAHIRRRVWRPIRARAVGTEDSCADSVKSRSGRHCREKHETTSPSIPHCGSRIRGS